MKKTILLLVLITGLLSSCFVSRTTVGYGPVGATIHDRTFAEVKHQYILFGLVSINEPKLPTPPSGVGYEIKSSFSFIDGILTLITVGIYGERTERILINRQDEEAIKEKLKH